MLIAWKDEFVIDHGIIDEDHQFLVRKLNTVIRRLNNHLPVGMIVETARHVRGFAALHFKREERLQVMAGYPFLAEHQAEHQELLRRLDDILEEFAALPKDEVIANPLEMKKYFYDWILGHIIGSDRRIAPFLGTTSALGEHSLASADRPKAESLHWRERAFGSSA